MAGGGGAGGFSIDLDLDGIDTLSREARAAQEGLPQALKSLYSTMADNVVADVRRRMPSSSGAAVASVQALNGTISYGGSRAPYVPWLDFGGAVGINKSVNRQVLNTGRYLFPAVSAGKIVNMNEAETAVAKAIESAGLEVSG